MRRDFACGHAAAFGATNFFNRVNLAATTVAGQHAISKEQNKRSTG
jgi:hypothetical protein